MTGKQYKVVALYDNKDGKKVSVIKLKDEETDDDIDYNEDDDMTDDERQCSDSENLPKIIRYNMKYIYTKFQF